MNRVDILKLTFSDDSQYEREYKMYKVQSIKVKFRNNLEYNRASLLASTIMGSLNSVTFDDDRQCVTVKYPMDYPNAVLSYITAIRGFDFELRAFDKDDKLVKTVEIDTRESAISPKKQEVACLFDFPTFRESENSTIITANKSGIVTYLSYMSSVTGRWREVLRLEFRDDSDGTENFFTTKEVMCVAIPRHLFNYEVGSLIITIFQPFSISRELIGVLLGVDDTKCTFRLCVDENESRYLLIDFTKKPYLDKAITRTREILRGFRQSDTPQYIEIQGSLAIPMTRAGLLTYFVMLNMAL